MEVVNDESALAVIVKKIIAANSQSVIDYKNSKDKAVGFLVGLSMRETKGKADPQMLNKLIKDALNKC